MRGNKGYGKWSLDCKSIPNGNTERNTEYRPASLSFFRLLTVVDFSILTLFCQKCDLSSLSFSILSLFPCHPRIYFVKVRLVPPNRRVWRLTWLYFRSGSSLRSPRLWLFRRTATVFSPNISPTWERMFPCFEFRVPLSIFRLSTSDPPFLTFSSINFFLSDLLTSNFHLSHFFLCNVRPSELHVRRFTFRLLDSCFSM
jgi:hypothetical protein